jgi:NAD(P)-dependent dehydrogenase (short-subunit alcohol dehydrogenase family)
MAVAELRGLLGVEGRGGCHHGRAREGTRSPEDPSELDQPRSDRDGGFACRRDRRNRLSETVEAQVPLGRVGQPDDIAPTAVYLASSDSKYMTGQALLVSGGLR